MQDEIKAVQKLVDITIDFFVNYSFQVIGAILVLAIGVLVARSVASFLLKLFERKNIDVTLSKIYRRHVQGYHHLLCNHYWLNRNLCDAQTLQPESMW